MKILVICYSRNGHTGRMAREIARRCGADLEAIREVQSDASWCARRRIDRQTLVRARPPIQPPQRNPARYDLVNREVEILDLPGLKSFLCGRRRQVDDYMRAHASRTGPLPADATAMAA